MGVSVDIDANVIISALLFLDALLRDFFRFRYFLRDSNGFGNVSIDKPLIFSPAEYDELISRKTTRKAKGTRVPPHR